MTELEYIKQEIKIINELYTYIKRNSNDCIMDTIKEFCFDKDLEFEYVGSLIADNKDLRDYAEKNLKKFKFIRELKPPKKS